MKNNLLIILFVSLIVIGWLLQDKCDKTNNDLPIIDNSELKQKVESLKSEISILNASNDSLTKTYADSKNLKDSVLFRTKTRYITIFDTITNDTIDCLPKIYVDTLILSFENVIAEADRKISVQDSLIDKQSETISIQDTIISNDKHNIENLKKEVKKEKRKGNGKAAKGGVVGLVMGFILGKAL